MGFGYEIPNEVVLAIRLREVLLCTSLLLVHVKLHAACSSYSSRLIHDVSYSDATGVVHVHILDMRSSSLPCASMAMWPVPGTVYGRDEDPSDLLSVPNATWSPRAAVLVEAADGSACFLDRDRDT